MQINNASLIKPIKAGDVKKGSYVVINNHPCRIVQTSTCKPGKHGHAKIKMIGIDIFTDQKYETMCQTSHNMDEPIINRTKYTVLNISDDNYLSLLKPDGTTKEDILLNDDEMLLKINEMLSCNQIPIVSVLNAMGIEKVIKISEDK